MREVEEVLSSLWHNLVGGRIVGATANTIELFYLGHQGGAKLIEESRMPRGVKAIAHLANFTSMGLTEGVAPVSAGISAGLFKAGRGIKSGINCLLGRP